MFVWYYVVDKGCKSPMGFKDSHKPKMANTADSRVIGGK